MSLDTAFFVILLLISNVFYLIHLILTWRVDKAADELIESLEGAVDQLLELVGKQDKMLKKQTRVIAERELEIEGLQNTEYTAKQDSKKNKVRSIRP